MSLAKELVALVAAAFSVDSYYKALNKSLKRVGGDYTMLHYPYFVSEDDSFLQGQKNLTDHCLAYDGDLKGLKVLEVGCGNGIQAMYVFEKYSPASITGIDLNPANIEIAGEVKEQKQLGPVQFRLDDAQKLSTVQDNSMQLIYSIESAFHYPDKSAFLRQVYRCLEPGGSFILADLCANEKKSRGVRKAWKKKLVLHHWTAEQYITALQAAGFSSLVTGDITENVIKGFLNYPLWFRQLEKKGWLSDRMFKLFYLINLKWYIYLLRKRRRYLIFYAAKPV